MKVKALLLSLLLVIVGYFGYVVLVAGEDPLARFGSLFQTASSVAPPPTVAVAPRAEAAPVPAGAPEASLAGASALVLSAPPRDNAEDGIRRFGPMAEYLSQVLGRNVVYKHPGDWGGYQSDMQRDTYDLVFDGPHFVSWRIEKYRHHALVKLPGDFLYVGFVRKENTRIQNIDQLAGHKVCVHAPPNLGTLMLLSAFDNPTRQPVIVITKGYENIYQGLMEDKCVGAMLPVKHLAKHDKNGEKTRVIYSHQPYPQQALTAGVRINAEDRAKLVKALMTPEAEAALKNFRDAYALGGWFVPASNGEYAGVSAYLKPVQGFYKPES